VVKNWVCYVPPKNHLKASADVRFAVAFTPVNTLHSAIWQLDSVIFNFWLPTRFSRAGLPKVRVGAMKARLWCEISTEIGFVFGGRSIGW
jgi:hypothetical protein